MLKYKKIITSSIIVVIIIILILLLSLCINKVIPNKVLIEDAGDESQVPIIIEDGVYAEKNETMFYTVVNCVQKYFNSISTAKYSNTTAYGREQNELSEDEKRKKIYEELSYIYIQENNITQENVRNFVNTANTHITFYPLKMNVLEKNSDIKNYAVYGIIRDNTNSNDTSYIYIIVTIDENNMTFAITPIIDREILDISEISLDTSIEEITKNDNNVFTYTRVNKEELMRKYIAAYKMYAINYPEIAYNYLDETYRNSRFGNIEEYKKYVNENKEAILTAKLDKYQITYEDNYTQYTCIDTNGNYYIFRETATMQYTLMLDTYTIDIPEFTDKYNSADEMTKVGMNIEKINAALNAKDYKYIYSKLPDSFKNNYFNTLEAFAEYMENTFYDKNTITYSEFSNEGKNYMFKIDVRDSNNTTNSPITKTIIMQLKEGTDFVFSFNV